MSEGEGGGIKEKCRGCNLSYRPREFGHLLVGEFAGCSELQAVQVNLQQPDVGEDGRVHEAWAAHGPLLQLRAQLGQQTKRV